MGFLLEEKTLVYNKSDGVWKKLMGYGSRLGCHQRPDRSFFLCGYQFPVCARCTGLLLGYMAALVTLRLFEISVFVSFALCVPLVVDGVTQCIRWRESNQFLRFITGAICGIGITRIEIRIILIFINYLGGNLL